MSATDAVTIARYSTRGDLGHILRTMFGDTEVSLFRISSDLAYVFADAIEIADECARSDIECNCGLTPTTAPGYYDSTDHDPEDTDNIIQALRYLDARGLVERHPQHVHLVRFPKVTP